MDHAEATPAGAEKRTPKSRVSCPIPIGWMVRIYRIPEQHGIAIQATHENGRAFTLGIGEDPDPSVYVTLPDGEKMQLSEIPYLRISDDVALEFLWSRCSQRMHELEAQGRLG